MSTEDVRRALTATRFSDVRYVAETGSTNEDLLAGARSGEPEGTVIVADHQRSGRGRLDRSWEAPPGASMLVSVLLRPPLEAGSAHWTVSMAALALAEACEVSAGLHALLKWPNDLVVDGEGRSLKLAGVLAESVVVGDHVEAIVVGTGCNLTWHPPDIDATSILRETGQTVGRDELLVSYLRRLDARYSQLLHAGGLDGLRAAYVERSATIGRRVRAELGDDQIVGTAARIAPSGHIVIETGGGEIEVAAGDVVHLRID